MYDDLTDRTSDLAALADVKRWNIIRTLRDQSVAEHSFMSAIIVMELGERLAISSDNIRMAVVWALVHDAPEGYTSDIDGKFKRENPEFGAVLKVAEDQSFPWLEKFRHALPPIVLDLTKLADKIEALSFISQHGYGSRAADVKSELQHIVFAEVIPSFCEKTNYRRSWVEDVVRTVLNHSLNEGNNIQLRRHRISSRPSTITGTDYKPVPFKVAQHVPGNSNWRDEVAEMVKQPTPTEGETD